MITTLLNFSGGMDSTHVLYTWLKNNPSEVLLVHHINLRHSKEDRLTNEQKAVKNVLKWLKRNGLTNFIYHESSFDYGDLPRISVKDIQIVALFAGIILRTPQWKAIDKVLLSWHKGEVDRIDIQKGKRVKAMFTALEVPEVEFLFPIENMSRKEMAATMPTELLRLTHSCRKPNGFKNCGRCKTCIELKEAKIFKIVGSVKNYV
jgi:7-cyano-7-deazaguanine synthase in queuosine biosynthesis